MKRVWVLCAVGIAVGWTAASGGGAKAAPSAEPSNEPPYAIHVAATPEAPAAGTEAVFRLTITPTAPWALKAETPFTAVLEATAGIGLAKAKLTADDFVDRTTAAKTVQTTFAAKAQGAQTVKASLTFFLCTDEICQRHKDTAELAVPVR